jgi:hypothetical protein
MSGDPGDFRGELTGTAEAGCLATEVKRSASELPTWGDNA